MALAKKKSQNKVPKTGHRSRCTVDVRTEISHKLVWVYPYLRKAKEKMPSLTLPKQIRPYRPTREKIMRVFGNVHFEKKLI
ncbi:MAG: hypothetical protein JNK65_09115, partial [Deltaproteobacteria bacterium]|nr:hypothetical protein [Deltaproteobacteria bacterium]